MLRYGSEANDQIWMTGGKTASRLGGSEGKMGEMVDIVVRAKVVGVRRAKEENQL